MRVESLNNVTAMFPSETSVSESNITSKSTQNIAESGSKPSPKADYSFKELAQKSRYELSVDEATWVDMVNRTNKAIKGATCSFEYSIHEETKEIMIKVIDRETKEVIREIPPEKILDLVAKLWEIAGILVDERR